MCRSSSAFCFSPATSVSLLAASIGLVRQRDHRPARRRCRSNPAAANSAPALSFHRNGVLSSRCGGSAARSPLYNIIIGHPCDVSVPRLAGFSLIRRCPNIIFVKRAARHCTYCFPLSKRTPRRTEPGSRRRGERGSAGKRGTAGKRGNRTRTWTWTWRGTATHSSTCSTPTSTWFSSLQVHEVHATRFATTSRSLPHARCLLRRCPPPLPPRRHQRLRANRLCPPPPPEEARRLHARSSRARRTAR